MVSWVRRWLVPAQMEQLLDSPQAGLWICHVESSLVDVGCSFCVVDGLTVEEVVEALPFTCTMRERERERERGG